MSRMNLVLLIFPFFIAPPRPIHFLSYPNIVKFTEPQEPIRTKTQRNEYTRMILESDFNFNIIFELIIVLSWNLFLTLSFKKMAKLSVGGYLSNI